MRDELEAGNTFEKVARKDLSGKLHDPERFKDCCPLEERQFVCDQFPEEDDVASEKLAHSRDPVPGREAPAHVVFDGRAFQASGYCAVPFATTSSGYCGRGSDVTV